MKNSTKNIVVAGLGGVAVGALLGILFAPAEGKKTRAAIKSKTHDLTDAAMEKAEDIADAAKAKASQLKEMISSADPSDILENLKSNLEQKYKSGKSDVKENLLVQIEKLEEAIKKA